MIFFKIKTITLKKNEGKKKKKKKKKGINNGKKELENRI